MAKIIKSPSIIKAAGNKEKIIREFIGNVNTGTSAVSVAMMKSPEGWEEPGQTPEFDEYTVVINGTLKVSCKDGDCIVGSGQAIIAHKGEWISYSSPFPGGAEYVSVCLPAFSPLSVHRDDE